MRGILFRGKRIDNCEWVYGYYYKQTEFYGDEAEDHIIITSHEDLSFDQALDYCSVKPETIGQFTGLTDKNGKVIFEGDIVVFNRGRNLPNSRPHPEVIFFDERNVQFTRYTSPYATLQKDMMGECEVIGNIHDNPDLLKTPKEVDQ